MIGIVRIALQRPYTFIVFSLVLLLISLVFTFFYVRLLPKEG